MFAVGCLPLALLGVDAVRGRLGANPIEAILNRFGYWTLFFLLLSLLPTPLRILAGGWGALIRYRRRIGLFAFFYGCLHLATYVGVDQFFDLAAILADIVKRKFIAVGFAAFVLLVPLALTSNDRAVRRLGFVRWKRWHRLVYASALLGVIHFTWRVKADLREPLLFAAVLAVLLAVRLVHAVRRQRTDGAVTGRLPLVDQGATLREIAWVFLKLGLLGFGGPAAHIAMMEGEVVRRRGWLSREQFLDHLGATNLIPGPNSTEMAIHIGRARAGWRGLLVAGTSFIAPAFVIVLACAWVYVRFGARPVAAGVLYGVKPVIIAVVVQALWGLGRTAARTRAMGIVGFLSVIAAAVGVHELLVILGAGVLTGAATWARAARVPGSLAVLVPLAGLPVSAPATAAVVPFGLTPLFLFFLKVGSVLFGSGYVLIAFLRADLVHRWGWLTEGQLLDAVAVGQVTPGPVLTTATFIGYVLGGLPGAVLATVGIFLPSFVFVALSGPLIPFLRRSAVAGAFLDGVNVASIGLMALVTAQLARAAVIDWPTALLAITGAILLIRFRVNSAWLVLAGALTGMAAHR